MVAKRLVRISQATERKECLPNSRHSDSTIVSLVSISSIVLFLPLARRWVEAAHLHQARVVELRVLRHQNRVARVDAGVEARRACNHMHMQC